MSTVIKTPLRVLVLSRNYPNEIQPQLGLWVERLVSRLAGPCEPVVVAPVPYCPPLPRFIEYARFRRIARVEQRHGVVVHHPRFLVGPGYSLHRYEAAAYGRAVRPLVERLFRDAPFDLIHAHFTYPDGVAAARLGERFGVPVVISEHALWHDWMDRYPSVRRQAIWASQACARHVAVSAAARDSIAGRTGSSDRLAVLPVGVDQSVFSLSEEPRVPNQILFVGFINTTKGIDVLLQAMRRLLTRRPEARLVLAGGAFYRHTRLQSERLRGLATELGLDHAVSFVGLQPPEAVATLMRQSAVLVLPSRRESFGSVLVEALACGTPVVATRCGGPEDIVTDEVGRLVPVEHPDALADALDDVLSSPGRYDPRELSRYATSRFSWDHIASQMVELYRDVIAHHPQRTA